VEARVVEGLLALVRAERMGEAVDRPLLKSLVRMLSSLGMYSEVFQPPFLAQAQLFYLAEGQFYMQVGLGAEGWGLGAGAGAGGRGCLACCRQHNMSAAVHAKGGLPTMPQDGAIGSWLLHACRSPADGAGAFQLRLRAARVLRGELSSLSSADLGPPNGRAPCRAPRCQSTCNTASSGWARSSTAARRTWSRARARRSLARWSSSS
jgi:hypothetical protein